MTTTANNTYPARLEIQYPERLDRVSTLFRWLLAMPILVLLALIEGGGGEVVTVSEGGDVLSRTSNSAGGIVGGLFLATALMIVVRQRYPRWWFDFARELTRFSTRVGAYVIALTDRYPATEDQQSVRLEIDYPEVHQDLNRWLPLVKWILAIPHYLVLAILVAVAIPTALVGWLAVLITARYPRPLFDYLVGVGRWALRVNAYAFLLVTDEYPPFRLT